MQTETMQTPELARAEARMPRWMMLCGFLALTVILLCGQYRIAVSFGLGAALGILNYYWLHEAVEALVKAGQSRIPKSVVAKLSGKISPRIRFSACRFQDRDGCLLWPFWPACLSRLPAF